MASVQETSPLHALQGPHVAGQAQDDVQVIERDIVPVQPQSSVSC
jgi:hypothetical protein